MQHKRTSNELRCFCSRRPILAMYGLDETGKMYIHLKVYKGSRIYGEMVVTGGTVRLHCRECLRWHRVVMVSQKPALREDVAPKTIEATTAGMIDDPTGSN